MLTFLLATLFATGASLAADTLLPAAPAAAPAADNPYGWLEDVTGERALAWVKARNKESTGAIETGGYGKLHDRFLSILDSDARIPYVTKMGELYYNLWQDKDHVRGIWRRTTLAEYKKASPAWQTVIDLDALDKAEGVDARLPDPLAAGGAGGTAASVWPPVPPQHSGPWPSP